MISTGKDIKKNPYKEGLFFYNGQILHCAFALHFRGDTQKSDRTVVIRAFFAGFNFKGVASGGKSAIDVSLALTFFVTGGGEKTKQQTDCADA